MGFFPAAGQEPVFAPELLAAIISEMTGSIGGPSFADVDTESWALPPAAMANLRNIIDEMAGAATPIVTEAALRALLGLPPSPDAGGEATASDGPHNSAQTHQQREEQLRDLITEQQAASRAAQQQAEEQARLRLEAMQRARQAAELAARQAAETARQQAALQAAERARQLQEALRQQTAALERSRAEAEAARRQALQNEYIARLLDEREKDRFARFPYYSAGESIAYANAVGVRAGLYSGIARGKDFGGNDITGTVDLNLNLDEDPMFSGQFNFGNVGTLNVGGYYGNPDYVAEYFDMYLESESFFDGVEFDSDDDANFGGKGYFFGPNGQEIGGDWFIEHEVAGDAGGEFAAARTNP